MQYLKPKYLFGGLLGTVVLGVISSAIWDGVKPLSIFLYKKILYISTLGIEKYKDGIYQNIAKGYHENVSLEIFVLINSLFLSAILVTVVFNTIIYFYRNGNHVVARKVMNLVSWPRNLSRRSLAVFILFYAVFVLTFFTLNLVKTKYENQAVVYYNQLIIISSPYLSEENIKIFQSRFAQIKNKSDYTSVVVDLEAIVKNNNLKKPEFNFIF
jgi:hypothetical protein